jgi:hypothetical protein
MRRGKLTPWRRRRVPPSLCPVPRTWPSRGASSRDGRRLWRSGRRARCSTCFRPCPTSPFRRCSSGWTPRIAPCWHRWGGRGWRRCWPRVSRACRREGRCSSSSWNSARRASDWLGPSKVNGCHWGWPDLRWWNKLVCTRCYGRAPGDVAVGTGARLSVEPVDVLCMPLPAGAWRCCSWRGRTAAHGIS